MNLESNIDDYLPSPQAVELVRAAKIVLLVGIAGAGKDTIKSRLLENDDFQDIVSHTTRDPRVNNGVPEVEGDDYHFIDKNKALEMVSTKEFIEIKRVHDTMYGTSVAELQRAYDNNKIAITDLDVQGVDEYKELSPGVVAIFILPPSYSVWRERLAKRYATEEEFTIEWSKRRASAIKELNRALSVPYYHFLINDDLDRAVRVADEIAHRNDSFQRKDDEARIRARDLLVAIETSL